MKRYHSSRTSRGRFARKAAEPGFYRETIDEIRSITREIQDKYAKFNVDVGATLSDLKTLVDPVVNDSDIAAEVLKYDTTIDELKDALNQLGDFVNGLVAQFDSPELDDV
jgi:hypothetical protein